MVYLPDFFENEPNETCRKNGPKDRFFLRPISWKITTAKEKEREKRESKEKLFYIGYFNFWHTLTQVSQECPQI